MLFWQRNELVEKSNVVLRYFEETMLHYIKFVLSLYRSLQCIPYNEGKCLFYNCILLQDLKLVC